MSAELAWIDLVGLGLVGLFAVLGIVRGLWWQVVRLIGIVFAVAVARALSPRWTPWVSEQLPDLSPGMANGLTWFGLFVVALVAASLLGLLGKKSLEAMKLGLVDRFGGALAGVTTGALVHAAVLVGLCELASPEWSQETIQGSRSQHLLDTLAGRVHLLLDANAAERLAPWLTGGREDPDSGSDPDSSGAPAPAGDKPRVR